jgi:hypothetical protein
VSCLGARERLQIEQFTPSDQFGPVGEQIGHFIQGGDALPAQIWTRLAPSAPCTVGERVVLCNGETTGASLATADQKGYMNAFS